MTNFLEIARRSAFVCRASAYAALLLLGSCGGGDEGHLPMPLPPSEVAAATLMQDCAPNTASCGSGARPLRADAPNVSYVLFRFVYTDELLDFAEYTYPDLFPTTGSIQGMHPEGRILYRYYPATGNYVGLSLNDGQIYLYGNVTGGQLTKYGSILRLACRIMTARCLAAGHRPADVGLPEGTYNIYGVLIEPGAATPVAPTTPPTTPTTPATPTSPTAPTSQDPVVTRFDCNPPEIWKPLDLTCNVHGRNLITASGSGSVSRVWFKANDQENLTSCYASTPYSAAGDGTLLTFKCTARTLRTIKAELLDPRFVTEEPLRWAPFGDGYFVPAVMYTRATRAPESARKVTSIDCRSSVLGKTRLYRGDQGECTVRGEYLDERIRVEGFIIANADDGSEGGGSKGDSRLRTFKGTVIFCSSIDGDECLVDSTCPPLAFPPCATAFGSTNVIIRDDALSLTGSRELMRTRVTIR